AQTLPFLAEKRVLVLEDTGFFKNAAEGLSEGLSELPDSTCMIFVESEVDKRSKVYKTVKKEGYVAELGTPDTKTLVTWIQSLCKRESKKIDAKTASYILEQCGTDMLLLSHEMEKLFSYAYERQTITVSDVEAVCVNQVTGKIFDMMDAITMHQQEKAISLYRDLLSLKEPALRILALLTRQVRILTEIKGLQTDNVPYGELASKAAIPPFTVKKYVSQCKGYTYSQLLSMFELCQETDSRIKTGRIGDVIGVELLIVEFSKEKHP
ncbi:MAG: DNA polymerase III subunit delta, partial [Lachnospiraceae bacterium]|nr:DNA polymerase III subunit delta [Lachnospiraceae bacterium]